MVAEGAYCCRKSSQGIECEHSRNISESPRTAGSIAEADKAREFLVGFMKCEFGDKTFENYIRNELAGDFACELKKAITGLVWQEQ